jgi:hypothetical protein
MTVNDPNMIAKTTIKETLIHDTILSNVKPIKPSKMTVNDPNMIAKTTIKETLIHDTILSNLRTAETRGTVQQLDNARTVGRETLEQFANNHNILGDLANVVHDPTDLRTTIKQTTLDSRLGNTDGRANVNAAYSNSKVEMKSTQKEFFSDNDYYGQAEMSKGGDGYQNVDIDVKDTMRQDPQEYFGTAGQGTNPTLYENMYNATSNCLKEEALVIEHAPVPSSTKETNYELNMQINKMGLPQQDQTLSRVKWTVDCLEADVNSTRQKKMYDNDDRLDVAILEPFKKNPYTKSLHSA